MWRRTCPRPAGSMMPCAGSAGRPPTGHCCWPSMTCMHLLCRRAPALPLAIVATARPWPNPALRAAEQLAASGLADIQRLAPLTDPAARDLLRDHFGDIDGGAADRVVAACDGNPLLLELAGPNLAADRPDLA